MSSLKDKIVLSFVGFGLLLVLLFAFTVSQSSSQRFNPDFTLSEIREITQGQPMLGRILNSPASEDVITDFFNVARQKQREVLRKQLFWFTLGGGALAVLGGYLLGSRVTKPIEGIASEMKKVDSTKLSHRIVINDDSEEIKLLVRSFNDLMNRLESAFTVQERFIQDAAHELRTPLAAMQATIQSVRAKKSCTQKDYESLVQTLELLNSDLISLNESLLFLEKNNREESLEKVNLSELLEDTIESLKATAQKEGIKIDKDIQSGVIMEAVPQDMVKMFRNIVDNAIKYHSESDPLVKISLKRKRSKTIFNVEDNGIGFSDKDGQKIFERFFRGSNATRFKGSGLGLSIVKKIVDRYKGEITIDSKQGVGTEVTITLG
ncbi:HAMP domain-containing histidine kinase [Candidatus Nomurabacteria bacterium]|nr:HAMP domain-containing histidine kinase [Candidatus Nomurabacteria bacterium]